LSFWNSSTKASTGHGRLTGFPSTCVPIWKVMKSRWSSNFLSSSRMRPLAIPKAWIILHGTVGCSKKLVSSSVAPEVGWEGTSWSAAMRKSVKPSSGTVAGGWSSHDKLELRQQISLYSVKAWWAYLLYSATTGLISVSIVWWLSSVHGCRLLLTGAAEGLSILYSVLPSFKVVLQDPQSFVEAVHFEIVLPSASSRSSKAMVQGLRVHFEIVPPSTSSRSSRAMVQGLRVHFEIVPPSTSSRSSRAMVQGLRVHFEIVPPSSSSRSRRAMVQGSDPERGGGVVFLPESWVELMKFEGKRTPFIPVRLHLLPYKNWSGWRTWLVFVWE